MLKLEQGGEAKINYGSENKWRHAADANNNIYVIHS
jgi:hypothetical protein